MIANVREGKVPMGLIDRAVRRILKQKFRLGLFERPLVDRDHAVEVVHHADHQELALEAARESDRAAEKREQACCRLRSRFGSIAVIGPNADDAHNQLGDYVPAVSRSTS